MSRMKMLRNGLFSVMMAAALGFGASQAFAAPQDPAQSSSECTDSYCTQLCQDHGYDTGVCDYRYQWGCRCWNW